MARTASPAATSRPERPDVFISYSRRDLEWVKPQLFDALQARGMDVWMDADDIPGGASDWEATIWAGMDASKAVIFVLSPDSVASPECRKELARALELNKRIISVLRRPVEMDAVPPALRLPNWIFASDTDDQGAALETLVTALKTDEDWLEKHARYTEYTSEWLREQRNTSYLLRGTNLRTAEEWLDDQIGHDERPTSDQVAYIKAGRRAAARRQRLLLGGVAIALAISVALGLRVYVQGRAARSDAFAAQSINVVQRDPEEAVRLALSAAGLGDGVLVKRALREAVGAATWTHILREKAPNPVNDATFSPDGRLAVTGGDSATANVWDVRSGEHVAALHHAGAIQTVQFSRDGRRIVTAALDATARLWDSSGRALRVLRPGGRNVWSAAFDSTGRRVITATDRGAAQVWDLSGGATPRIRLPGRAASHLAGATFSPDGRRALVPGPGSGLRVWTLGPRPRATVLRHPDADDSATVAAFSPDGRRVLSGNTAGTVCVWVLRPRSPARSCVATAASEERDATITAAEFSRDGKRFLSASNDWTAAVRRTRDLRRLARLRHRGPIGTAAFNRDASAIVTAGEDRTARIWTAAGDLERELAGHTGAVHVATFSRDGTRVITGSDDGTARIWVTRKDDVALPGRALRDAEVAFSPDSQHLLAADGTSGRAAVWDLRTRPVDLHGTLSSGEASWPCGHYTGCAPWGDGAVAGVAESGEATLWDASTGAPRGLGIHDASAAALRRGGRQVAVTPIDSDELLRPGARRGAIVRAVAGGRATYIPRDSKETVSSARFEAGGRLLLTIDAGGNVRLSDARTGASAGPGATATVPAGFAAAGVSPDGTQLAVAARSSGDDRLVVRDVATGATRTGSPQPLRIVSLAFDRSGSRIVTAGQDLTARVWDAGALGAPTAVLRGHGDPLQSAEFSPDGRFVLTTSQDGTARLWDPELETMIATYAKSAAGGARFSPDGKLVAVGGPDTVHVHRCELCASFDELVRIARRRLPDG